MKAVLNLVLLLFPPAMGSAHAEQTKTGFVERIHHDANGYEARYVLFVPHDYTGARPYPLILFLHGLGESGNDGRRQVDVGLGPAIRKREDAFPFLVIFLQSQKKTWQAGSEDAQRAMAILTEVEKDYRVDPKRFYLTGLSMGGFGTWSLAAKYPDRWAAIVPVCGGGNPDKARLINEIPCWCFHGAKDPTVPVQLSRQMISALEAAGGKPKYTEYPAIKHNSWDRAYGTPELYDWLLQQHLK